MRSRMAISGHPIHPMLVPIPIGLAVWAFIADLVYLATDKDQTWYDISYWTGLATVISALVAALPGLVDYLLVAVKSSARALATFHMLMNFAFTGLYFAAYLLMMDNRALNGDRLTAVIVLHALGAGILGLSGWIGGEIVYRHHVSMIPDDERLEEEEIEHHRLPLARHMR